LFSFVLEDKKGCVLLAGIMKTEVKINKINQKWILDSS